MEVENIKKLVPDRNLLELGVRGGLAGFGATIPMTAFMLLAHRLLPQWEQYALPPQRITDKLAQRAGLRKHIDKRQLMLGTLASHFGYGTTMGVIYRLATGRLRQAPLLGPAFGLAVWAASYLGWLPAFDILPPATKVPPKRAWLVVVAHLVWGASAGALLALRPFSERSRAS